MSILPFPDTCALLRLTGSALKQVLEHAVSGVEEKEGRFPCISGFSFKFDPSKPQQERIVEVTLDDKGPI